MNDILGLYVVILEVFYENVVVLIFDLVIGKFDLVKMVVYFVCYFEFVVFMVWMKVKLLVVGFVGDSYNSVNVFVFVVFDGICCLVCWLMCVVELFMMLVFVDCVG